MSDYFHTCVPKTINDFKNSVCPEIVEIVNSEIVCGFRQVYMR